MKEKKGVYKKKGAAESKELTEDGPAIDVADKGVAKKKGAAEYGGKKGDDSKSQKDYEGSGKKKGGAKHIDGDKGHKGTKPDFPDVDGDGDKKEPLKKAAKEAKTVPTPGAAMGFTQNFGPARQNSYARGAAKIAKIMGKLHKK